MLCAVSVGLGAVGSNQGSISASLRYVRLLIQLLFHKLSCPRNDDELPH